jgi:hypothetical protein
MYVHCAAHNLNLVVNDAVCGVKETSVFCSTLQELYIFFGHSIRRWDILSSITGESDVTVKKLNPTRWAGRLASVMGVKLRYTDVMKALSQIVLLNANKDEREESARLKKSLERYEFVLLVVIMSRVLSEINIASQYLQRKDADLQKAVDHLSSASLNLSNYRSQFAEVKDEATNVCAKWGVLAKFEQKRFSKTKRHFDELSEDTRLTDPEDSFRVNVFNITVDTVTTQLQQRFIAMKHLAEKFSVLNPDVLAQSNDQQVLQRAEALQREYEDDLSPAFPMQMVCFRASMQAEIAKLHCIKELAHMLIVENASVSSGFADIVTALLLFLTLPVTVATAERSFSKLKIIKNYLRNTMGQTRLRGLSILAIEASRAKNMSTDQLIERFAEMKARKIKLN